MIYISKQIQLGLEVYVLVVLNDEGQIAQRRSFFSLPHAVTAMKQLEATNWF